MIDTPIGPIPTLADLSILAGRPTFSIGNGNIKRERKDAVYRAWLKEIGEDCPVCDGLMYLYEGSSRGTAPDQITFDHILARSLGGDNATTNLWCICRACNGAKGTVEARQAEQRRSVPA